MGLPVLTNWKGDTYDSILVNVDQLTKMVYYKLVKITIDTFSLAGVILDMVIKYHGLPNSIMSDWGSIFNTKFCLLLCYFLRIKQSLSTTFYPQTDSQTKRQNSTMEAYLQAFVNVKLNDWTRLLPIAEFAYNNTKDTSIGHTPFGLNYGFYPRASYEEDIDRRSKSKSIDKLATEPRELMTVYRENL